MTNRTTLDQARADLAAIESNLAALLAKKIEASKTAASFDEWRSTHGAIAAERERLTVVIEGLEPTVAAEEAGQAKVDLLRRYEARNTANQKLAARIKADLTKANNIVLALVRETAEAAVEDSRINAALPDDLEPLIPADFIARGRPGLDRKELSKTKVWLWTNARNGMLIGDQDAVIDLGNGRGKVGQGSGQTNCVAALFEQVEYCPEEPAQRPRALWQLALPQPDGPGLVFDGSKCNYPTDVLAELARGARANEPRERPIEIELRPVQPAATEAA